MSKEEQIKEIAEITSRDCGTCSNCEYGAMGHGGIDCIDYFFAHTIYNAGYRKQSEGENVATHPSSAFECSECHWEDLDLYAADSAYNFCPNCGAKMKGGEG